MAAQVRRLGAGAADIAILASSFVSPLTRDRLADAGLGWFDTVGNLRLRLDRPSVVIEQVGAARNPYSDPTDRRLKTLRGPGSARIVRALCETDLPMGVRTLAQQSQVSAATSARVLDLLDREAVIGRGERGEVVAVRKRSLIRRWTEDYGLSTSNEVTSAIDPRGLDHAVSALRNSSERYVATGSAAQRAYLPSGVVPVAPLTTLVVHAENPRVLMREVGLVQTERGANVLVVRPMDDALQTKPLICWTYSRPPMRAGRNDRTRIRRGAQAVYWHAGDADLAVAPTTDADIALVPGELGAEPLIAEALRGAGFVPGANPGT